LGINATDNRAQIATARINFIPFAFALPSAGPNYKLNFALSKQIQIASSMPIEFCPMCLYVSVGWSLLSTGK